MATDKIKVAVRVRPFNRRELEMGTQCVVEMSKEQTILQHPTSIQDKIDRNKPKTFAFDHCFFSLEPGSENFASQEVVFNALGRDILDNAFQGYNACIFAYGQTGSGKSYTMMGSGDNKGIIPRLCDNLFDMIAKQQSSELSYKVEVSYMEIYNEKVHDLLDPKQNKQSLKVREHNVLGPYVDGLSQLAVTAFQDIDNLMAEGNKSRTVAATNMNSESSRSHAVFSVVLTQTLTDSKSGVSGEKVSRMSLVDLAGSERAVKTGAVGDRLKEGSNINKSLTTLGLVISKLADQSSGGKNKDKFVPYRDSVLTWLLKDNLGGNSKTVMVATISPAADNYEETLSTLRYADRAKRIVNHAVVNEDPNARIIRELRQEVEALKEMLLHATGQGSVVGQQRTDITEKLSESERLMKAMSQTWEEKLVKTERLQHERQQALEKMGISVQASGIQVEKNKYYLVNLNADPSLNELLVYYLKEQTLVGGRSAAIPQDIQLHGLGIQPEHCVITIEESGLYMTPLNGARCFINGSQATDRTPLHHGDRIVWGNHHFFRVNCPRSATAVSSEPQTPAQNIDYNFAREELMLNELSNDPIQTAIARLEKQHEEDKQVALEKQRQEYERQFQQLRNILSPSTPYSPYVPYDPLRGSQGGKPACTPTTQMRVEKWAQERDEMFKRSLGQLKADILRANSLVQEANFLAEEMDKQTKFSVTLQIPPNNLSPNRKRGAFVSEPAILVKRINMGSQVWSMEKLENKLVDMRDMYEDRKDSHNNQRLPTVKDELPGKTQDPFYESQENHNLIGVANIFLEVLFHDVRLDYHTPIISQQGEVAGRLQVEMSRTSGQFPQDRICEAASDSSSGDSTSFEQDDYSESNHITCRITIKQASGLPLSLSHFVFCQYIFWGHPEPIVVPPVVNPELPVTQFAPGHRDSLAFKFEHTKDFTVPITDEFLEHCSEGALSIEVWGHRSTGFSRSKPGWEVEQQQLAKARSLADRWAELTRKIELWVEIQELNELGEYTPVEVAAKPDMLTGGVYQLRQGQQRRIQVRVKPVQNSGTLPIICQSILNIGVGSVSVRNRLQKPLDSYQEEDLSVLREKWSEALMRRRQYLDQHIQKLINKQANKTEQDIEREQSLLDQWVSLTEERNAVLVPTPGSGIPGAPADWIPPPGMEPHIPVLFLDLNADDLSTHQSGEEVSITGLNSILPKEHGNKFYNLPIIRHLEKDVCAIAAWDSSLHDSVNLNRVTEANERVYLILKTTVRLSHPAPMDLVLRKRLALNIYKRQSITDRFFKRIVRTDCLSQSGVTYEVVSNIPKASEELEDRESLAQIAASGEDSSLSDGETYIEKYTRGVSAVESILTLDRLRQSVAVKELLQAQGQPLMRKTASVPNFSQIMRFDTSMESLVNVARSESVTDLNSELTGLPHTRRSLPGHAKGDENSFLTTPPKPFGIDAFYCGHRIQQTRVTSVMSEPQRALISTISEGHHIIRIAESELSSKAQLPELGTDPASLKWIEQTMDTHKQNVGSQIAAMNAATAQVVTLTSGPADDVDHTAVGAAITTIASNLPEMTKGVRMIAALLDDESSGDRLLDAARKLCLAFSDLLKATEPETKEPRQNLLNAASRVGEASHQVLTTIGEEDDSNRELQDMLLALAKAVANTTAALVVKAKNIATTCEDSVTQNRVISAATQCALATSQLVACAKVVAPTLHSPACQTQLMNAVREVTRAVEGLVEVCNETCTDENLLRELSSAAAEVSRTLNDLLNRIQSATRAEKAKESVQEGAVETIFVATDKLFASTGDAGEMVRQAKVVGQATAQLIHSIKGEAESQTDGEQQRRLLAAAKILADATAKMVEAARQCASSPHDANMQDQLRRAAEELRAATTAAATPGLRRKLITRLESCAKQAAANATQCISAASGAAKHNTNAASQEELNAECRAVAQQVPNLVAGVKGTLAQPDNPTAQLNLINASEQFLQPGSSVIKAARAVVPTVSDQASAMQLNNSSQQLGSTLSDLRSAVTRAREACGGLELDAAEELINSLKDELYEFYQAVEAARLRPLPGETAESTALQLGASSKNVGFAMAQLLSAAKQGNENYTGSAARETATALKELTSAVRGVAATSNQPETQKKVLTTADDIIIRSLYLVKEARRALNNPDNPDNVANLAAVAKDVSQSLNKCVSCLPGQRDVDDAIRNIDDMSQVLNMNEFPQTNKSYGQLQQNLNTAAADLNDASANVVSSVRSPVQLANTSKEFTNAFGDLLGVSMEMAGQTTTETRGQMVVSLKNVSMTSSKLLVTAKSVAADPNAPNAKNQLSAAARAVTDSINYLIDVCTSAAPGQNECDNAIRNIQSMRPLLDNPSDPISDVSYFECLDTVMEKSKSLGDGMTGIANHAKKSEHEQFSVAVRGVSSSICGLVEAAAQAAYLAGVSDPTSVAGKPGLVDQAQFFRAAQAIHTGCQNLTNPTSTPQQVLHAATMIAKHTSALCNACRVASSKTTNPVAKRHFVQSAKDVANSTGSLVKEIKALDQDCSEANRERCSEATRPLLEAVDNLCNFASSPEFASQPAKISVAARAAQEPITSAGKSIIDGSCAMVQAAKSLAVSPKDPPTWQLLANHSKSVSDSIKSLVASIRDKAPGQKECDAAIETLSSRIRELDAASLSVVSQALVPRKENTVQGFTDQMESSASELREKLEPLRSAAKYGAEHVGHAVSQIALYSEPLVTGAIGAASNMVHSKQQMVLLDQTKTVAESTLQLIYVAKESGGNPKAVNLHAEVDETVESTKDALRELQNTLETISTSNGIVTGLIDTISRAMVRLEDHRMSTIDTVDSYVDYQTRMVEAAKEIARLAQEMSTKSSVDVARLGPLAVDVSHKYTQLSRDASGASAATTNADVSLRLRTGVQELGRACADIVRAAGTCQMASGDAFAQREVSEHSKNVTEKVSQVLAALQAGSRGTQACINAASTVSGIIGDLDTTIMFATAGTLHAENDSDIFADHRENILKTAKALVEDTKTLVAGAASSQEQLAVAAQNAVSTIVQLAEVVKYGAASLGSHNPEAQVMLINAVKDVASALGDLIQATKTASGKPINDPSMAHLKDSAKVMVTNVTSLLKTVKAVEDEHTRGTRALESTIEAIGQEIRSLNTPDIHRTAVTPEDLVRCTKNITTSTAKAVAAGNSCKQDDIIAAANMGRKAISDMLMICKNAAYHCAETAELRDRTLNAGHDVALNYRELLQSILQISIRPSDAKHLLPPISRKIAQSVTELVTVAELLKGNDWVDPDDPTVIAENELLGAAASIDAAAKKLASLRPRRSIQEASEDMNFDEMILEAAKSIAAATSALIKAASAAQRELIATGKVSRTPLTSSDDGQWSEGLISAARLVAAATHSLVESANALVQGVSSEEKLISSAKQVASSTAQLLVACKVKADPDSESTKRLQAAGNAVKRATDNLVRAAQQAIQQEEDRSLVLNRKMVGGIAQEINARSEVLRIERELEEARGRLTAIRQAKYKSKTDTSDDAETDADQSGYESYTTRYETRAYEPNQSRSPIQLMTSTLDDLQPTTQYISHRKLTESSTSVHVKKTLTRQVLKFEN